MVILYPTGPKPMSDNTTMACPKCQTRLMIPNASLGAKVQCPTCKTILQTQVAKGNSTAPTPKATAKPTAKPSAKPSAPPPSKPAPAPPAKEENFAFQDQEEDGQYGVNREAESHRCPSCANELTTAEDVICLTCGYDLRSRTPNRLKKLEHKGVWDYVLWLLLAGLFTVLIIALIVWDVLVFTKLPGWLGSEESWGNIMVSHGFFRLWNTIFSIGAIWAMGKYAIARFFFEPHPPEVEILK